MTRIPAATHEPVMVDEVLEVLEASAGGLLLDGTVGTFLRNANVPLARLIFTRSSSHRSYASSQLRTR